MEGAVLNYEEPLTLPEVEPNNELNITTGRITHIEIENAIKTLKTGRLQDVTMYHHRQLRWEGTLEEVLLDFYNRIWSEEKIPQESKKGLPITLLKKGDLSYCKNWLGIMLLNMAIKVFCRVILERIKIALDEK